MKRFIYVLLLPFVLTKSTSRTRYEMCRCIPSMSESLDISGPISADALLYNNLCYCDTVLSCLTIGTFHIQVWHLGLQSALLPRVDDHGGLTISQVFTFKMKNNKISTLLKGSIWYNERIDYVFIQHQLIRHPLRSSFLKPVLYGDLWPPTHLLWHQANKTKAGPLVSEDFVDVSCWCWASKLIIKLIPMVSGVMDCEKKNNQIITSPSPHLRDAKIWNVEPDKEFFSL